MIIFEPAWVSKLEDGKEGGKECGIEGGKQECKEVAKEDDAKGRMTKCCRKGRQRR